MPFPCCGHRIASHCDDFCELWLEHMGNSTSERTSGLNWSSSTNGGELNQQHRDEIQLSMRPTTDQQPIKYLTWASSLEDLDDEMQPPRTPKLRKVIQDPFIR